MSEVVSVTDRMTSPQIVEKLKYYIPNVNRMEEYLSQDSQKLISTFFPAKTPPNVSNKALYEKRKNEKKALMESGIGVLKKVRLNPQVRLSKLEKQKLCALIVNFARPAFLIENGSFPPKMGDDQRGGLPPNWSILDDYREEIETTCQSVGRVEPCERGREDLAWGTGFLVAKDVVMTNKHVIDCFAYPLDGSKVTWKIRHSTRPRVDIAEEYGSFRDVEFAITKVIGVHKTLDLALLKVNRTSPQNDPLPEPLVLDSKLPEPTAKRKVYIVGYPFDGTDSGDPEDLELIFNNLFGYKRLQPGEATGAKLEATLLFHDCSTIGGNSGSCVVDLERNTVIGLHFHGELVNEYNTAVALPLLSDDPFLKKHGVNFN